MGPGPAAAPQHGRNKDRREERGRGGANELEPDAGGCRSSSHAAMGPPRAAPLELSVRGAFAALRMGLLWGCEGERRDREERFDASGTRGRKAVGIDPFREY